MGHLIQIKSCPNRIQLLLEAKGCVGMLVGMDFPTYQKIYQKYYVKLASCFSICSFFSAAHWLLPGTGRNNSPNQKTDVNTVSSDLLAHTRYHWVHGLLMQERLKEGTNEQTVQNKLPTGKFNLCQPHF